MSAKSFQQIWRQMDHEHRRQAAESLLAEDNSMQQAQAATVIATRLKLRPQKAAKLPLEKKAGYLTALEHEEPMAAMLVRAYLFQRQRPMLAMFLDELAIPHKNGVIEAETVAAPAREALDRAVQKIRENFDGGEVDLYVSALLASDPETWANLKGE